jgi:hypothetical protein
MKMPGSIRRTEPRLGRSIVSRSIVSRSVASRESPPLLAFQDGTALPGPDAHHSGPGLFFAVGSPKLFCAVPKSVLPQRTSTSYFIPLERKSRLGATRSNSHE